MTETGDLTEEELVRALNDDCDETFNSETYRMVREIRRRRATEDFLRGFAAGLSRNSTPGRIVAEALLRILDGGAS